MLRARATWGAAPRGSCEDRASNKYNTDSFCSTQTFRSYRPGAEVGEFGPRGHWFGGLLIDLPMIPMGHPLSKFPQGVSKIGAVPAAVARAH